MLVHAHTHTSLQANWCENSHCFYLCDITHTSEPSSMDVILNNDEKNEMDKVKESL